MSARLARSLTEGPIGRNLLLFSLAILGGNVAQSLNGSVNAVWVGKFLGESALTAVANANNIMFFLIGSVFGIGMAATILIGQAIGAGDDRDDDAGQPLRHRDRRGLRRRAHQRAVQLSADRRLDRRADRGTARITVRAGRPSAAPDYEPDDTLQHR